MKRLLPLVLLLFFQVKTGFSQQIVHACCDTFVCLPGTEVTLTATVDTGSTGTILNINDDTYSQVIDLGFPFTFYGNTYTQCVLSTNAYITFDLNNAFGYSPWPINDPSPSPLNPLNSIYGPWHDVDPSQPPYGTMGFHTFGNAPNRFFVYNFCSVPMFQCNDTLFTGQIILYETTNEIEIHIGEKRECYTWNNGAAIEGVQNWNGSDAVIIPGRNYPSQWTAFNDAYRFTPSGNTYTYAAIPYAPVAVASPNPPDWYDQNGDFIASGYTITVSPEITTTYIATTALCGFSADSVTIVVGSIPATYASTDLTCENSNDGAIFTYPIDNSGPYDFVWINSNGDTIQQNNSVFGDSVLNLAAGTYTVIFQNSLGCITEHVFVVNTPVYNAAFSVSPALICDGDVVTFNNLSFGDIQSLSWDLGDGSTSTLQNPTHTYASPGTYTVVLTIVLGPNCTDTYSQTIEVHSNLVISFSVSPPAYCIGEEIQFTDNSIGHQATWSWDFGDGSTSSEKNPVHTYSYADTFFVHVFVADSFCGAGDVFFTIGVLDDPSPLLRPDTTLCSGEVIYLAANDSSGFYLWSTGETTPDINYVMPDVSGFVWVEVNNQGCIGRDSVFFTNHCVMMLPAAFSPNGDGNNDVFHPLGNNTSDYSFLIFNRWGQQVYSGTSGNIEDGWNGEFEGEPQAVGVYVYYFTGHFNGGKAFQLSGNVTLVR